MQRGIVLPACVLLIPALASAQALFIGSQDPFGGAGVFNAKGCVKCHAISGVAGNIGPDLARTEGPRSFYDLAASLWNHAPKMAARMRQLEIARPHLDSREAGDLAGYLFTLSYFERQGNAVVGRRLFAEKRCVACHSVGSTGGTIGPRLDGVTPATAFAHEEMADLVAYLRSLKRAN